MLKTLQIKNFALIDSLEVEFCPGLNIITGETGAGKSIIVDAFMIVLGERASTDFIRYGENKAVVEGIFDLPEDHPVFARIEENGYDRNGNELIIRREILAKGNSRCFLNDSPIPVGLLKQFGDLLVDFHGQHQHQLLLNSESHIGILDITANIGIQKNVYSRIYNNLREKTEAYTSLVRRERSLREKEDLQRFELSEIDKVAPQPDEEDQLENELNKLENSETLHQLTAELYAQLYDGDASVHDALVNAKKTLEQLLRIDNNFESYLADCTSALIASDEIALYAKDYDSNIQFDPQRAEDIRERLQALKGLRKKYGTFENIFVRREELDRDLRLIGNFEDEIKKMRDSIIEMKKELGRAASDISESRKRAAADLSDSIVNVLKSLGMPNARFTVEFEKEELIQRDQAGFSTALTAIMDDGAEYRAYPEGIDICEFYFSANKGEMPKPLAGIASGGEISRVMLAIKSIIADADHLPILVFDEIDTGISGRIARMVGLTMKNLAEKHQIISITHLPQIAALGDKNIIVKKLENDGRTVVQAKSAEGRERLVEVARLISGEDVTEASIQSAMELSERETN